MKKGNPQKKAERIDSRASKKMDKAKSTWNKAEAMRKSPVGSNRTFAQEDFGKMAHQVKTERLYAKSARQADKAKDLKTRAGIVRAGSKK
jgi:hypothetical protein